MNQFSWPEMPKQMAFPIASPGYPYIAASAFTTLIFALIGVIGLTILGLISTFFICYFFRDPDRLTPNIKNAVVSPADGRIVQVGMVDNNPFIPGVCLKIGIFMSIFNVHVNRIPYSGTIRKISYQCGKFFSADKDVASTQNEFNAIVLETNQDQMICFVQIAGLIARRIICSLQEGETVTVGRRFGMICFGSRVDVYLPQSTTVKVSVGDKVSAGNSVLGIIEQDDQNKII